MLSSVAIARRTRMTRSNPPPKPGSRPASRQALSLRTVDSSSGSIAGNALRLTQCLLRRRLLCLTLFASLPGFAPKTAAQITMTPMELHEGETVRFNLSNLPVINSTAINVRLASDPGTSMLTADYNVPD